MRLPSFIVMLFTLTLTGCAAASAVSPSAPDKPASPYPDLGVAPELTNQTWLNTPASLRLAGLRGKVVLIDMWTFG